ncbi:MAG: hypothetical protein KKD31_15690 [Bacteroidetes bacterium]|nr:hypothetical protein [Bacteroidota bacterium]
MIVLLAACHKEKQPFWEQLNELTGDDGVKRWEVTGYRVDMEDRTGAYRDSCGCVFEFRKYNHELNLLDCHSEIVGWVHNAGFILSRVFPYIRLSVGSNIKNFDSPYRTHSSVAWEFILHNEKSMILQTESDNHVYSMTLEAIKYK